MSAFAVLSKPKRHRRKKTNVHQKVHVVYRARPSPKRVAQEIHNQCEEALWDRNHPWRGEPDGFPVTMVDSRPDIKGAYSFDIQQYRRGLQKGKLTWVASDEYTVRPDLSVERETTKMPGYERYYEDLPELDACMRPQR